MVERRMARQLEDRAVVACPSSRAAAEPVPMLLARRGTDLLNLRHIVPAVDTGLERDGWGRWIV